MDGGDGTTPGKPAWDVRIARKRQRLPEAEYRAALARGEIQRQDATADVVRGDALIAQVQQESGCRQCLMAFSTGKDSIAAYLAIRAKFERVTPFYMYGVPGLSFIEESLDYYERELFDEPIIRMPHPSFYAQLDNLVFQPPERIMLLKAAHLGDYDHDYMRELILEEIGMPETAYIATGIRSHDNTMRRMAVSTYGPVNRKQHVFWPIWDWKKADVVAAIKAENLHLPVDYDLFGRTWDGITAHDLIPIRDHFPDDYAKILEWFPLADAEIFRLETYGAPRDIWELATKAEDRPLQAKRRREARTRREAQARRFSSLEALSAGRRSA